MGMGFAPTWLRQVSPPASQNHFNHCPPPVSWPLTFLRWKWCPSHMWRWLPLCKC